jgi:hypothetical protein
VGRGTYGEAQVRDDAGKREGLIDALQSAELGVHLPQQRVAHPPQLHLQAA